LENQPRSISVDDYIGSLTIEQKVGQMVMVDFSQTTLTDDLRRRMEEHAWGGVILFVKNCVDAEQTRQLIRDLQEVSIRTSGGLPLIVCVDQEGGPISPIPFFCSRHPGNMALGATRNAEYVHESARLAAGELRSLGFTMDLAPVVDVNNNPRNPVIGTRSFSDSSQLVARLAVNAIRGYQENGIAACAKHFPGHGDTGMDSHLGLPSIQVDGDRLERIELPPFRAAMAEKVAAIMPAHILYPAVEPLAVPVTISRRILTGMIREQMQYNGLVITDSMTMKAISDNFGLGEAAVMAVQAGADIVLACGTIEEQETMYQFLLAAVREGRISEARLNQSLSRIIRIKLQYPWPAAPFTGSPEGLIRDIARDSITLVKNQDRVVPLSLQPDQVLVVIQPELPRQGQQSLAQHFAPFHPAIRALTYPPLEGKLSPAQVLSAAEEAGAVVIATWSRGNLPDFQREMVRLLQNEVKVPLVVASIFNPYHLLQFPEVGAYLCTYSDHPQSLRALAECIMGRLNPRGALPVGLSDRLPFGHGLHYQ